MSSSSAPSGTPDDSTGRAPGVGDNSAGATAVGGDEGRRSRLGRDIYPELDPDSIKDRQEDRFGGIKWGSAFFGWLTAIGVAALLTTLLAAAGTALGVASDATPATVEQEATAATDTAQTVGLVGGIALLVILFVAYYCGGYVAGRMARFNGTKQGLAVWLWAVIIAIVVAVLAAAAGARYNVLATLNLPRIPVDEGTLTTGGIVVLAAVALASLAGALLGGKAGMHFHRKVDRAALPS